MWVPCASLGFDRSVAMSVLLLKFMYGECEVHSARRLLTEVPCHGGSVVDPLGSLGHYLDAVHCFTEQGHVVRELRISKLLHRSKQQPLLLRIPLHQRRFLASLHHNRWSSNPLWSFLNGGRKFRGIITCLTLLSLGNLGGRGRGTRSIGLGMSWVVVHALHVVTEVPVAGEAISLDAALAAFVGAEERLVAVAMHGVSFALVA